MSVPIEPEKIPEDATILQMLRTMQALAFPLQKEPERHQLHVFGEQVFAFANEQEKQDSKFEGSTAKKCDFLTDFVFGDTGERLHRLGLCLSEPHIVHRQRSWYIAIILKHPRRRGDILLFWDPAFGKEAKNADGSFCEKKLFHESFSGENVSRVRRHMLNIRGIMGSTGEGSCGEVWAGGVDGDVDKSNARSVMIKMRQLLKQDWNTITSKLLVDQGFERMDNGPQNIIIDY